MSRCWGLWMWAHICLVCVQETQVHTFVFVFTSMYGCICALLVYASVSLPMYVCLCVLYVCIHICIYVHTCLFVNIYVFVCLYVHMYASQVVLVVKNLPSNARDIRDMGLIPGSGRSPQGGYGNPLHYSWLENSTDRGAWWATVLRVTKIRTRLKQLAHMHAHVHMYESVCMNA